MEVTISRGDMLARIGYTWMEWQAVLADVPPERMEVPMMGAWTVKDIVAHITWHEREMIELVRSKVFDGSPLWREPTDVRNEAIYQQNQDRPLEDVLREQQAAHGELMELLKEVSEADLNEPGRIAQMPEEWNLALILQGNTWEHYPEHTEPLKAWLES